MSAGFVGAGKVGCSLGRVFHETGLPVAGYAGRRFASSVEAAAMTGSRPFETLEELAAACDILFITVPDGSILKVWNELRGLPLAGKVVCHCSGSLPAALLEHASALCVGACSLHPLYAVSSRESSWKELATAVFTLEGDPPAVAFLRDWLAPAELCIQPLEGVDKTRYHAAAVFASNLVVGLAQEACDLLKECGFGEETAIRALAPLLSGNMARLVEQGVDKALTGPVERNDTETVARHLAVLHGDTQEIYRILSCRLVEIAARRHPERDMDRMRNLLKNK